jgi:alanine dehydrogenase
MHMTEEHLMTPRTTLILGDEDVRSLLDVRTVLELQHQAFIQLADDRATISPNLWLRPPLKSRGWLKILAGYDHKTGALGTKILARFPENPPGTNLGAIIVLFDNHFGFPVAIVDATHITALKTAAGAALATSSLALSGARSIGVVGSGVLAWWTLAFLAVSCPDLRTVSVYSRSRERRDRFAARANDELGFDARSVASVEEATQGANVIITATNSPEPVLLWEHLRPGQHINAVGIRTEIAPEVIAAAAVTCDGRNESLADGKFSVGVEAGVVTPEDLGPTLGEVLSGRAEGRSGPSEITLFDSSGVALQDLVCAQAALERAREVGAGTVCSVAPQWETA